MFIIIQFQSGVFLVTESDRMHLFPQRSLSLALSILSDVHSSPPPIRFSSRSLQLVSSMSGFVTLLSLNDLIFYQTAVLENYFFRELEWYVGNVSKHAVDGSEVEQLNCYGLSKFIFKQRMANMNRPVSVVGIPIGARGFEFDYCVGQVGYRVTNDSPPL